MSFGYGVADTITLIQLAWRTFEGAKRACGEYDEMTSELGSLHAVLEHLQAEIENPDSLINNAEEPRRVAIENHMKGCEEHLKVINSILKKYNALTDVERSGKKLWKQVQFGNGKVAQLADIRLKIATYNTAIAMSLHLLSHGSQSRIERRLSRQSGDLEGIRESVDLVVAKLSSQPREGSIMTSYSNDEKSFWRTLRRELVKDGYNSEVLKHYQGLIQDYVRDLGSRGALDDPRSSRLSLSRFEGTGNSSHAASMTGDRHVDVPDITTSYTSPCVESRGDSEEEGEGITATEILDPVSALETVQALTEQLAKSSNFGSLSSTIQPTVSAANPVGVVPPRPNSGLRSNTAVQANSLAATYAVSTGGKEKEEDGLPSLTPSAGLSTTEVIDIMKSSASSSVIGDAADGLVPERAHNVGGTETALKSKDDIRVDYLKSEGKRNPHMEDIIAIEAEAKRKIAEIKAAAEESIAQAKAYVEKAEVEAKEAVERALAPIEDNRKHIQLLDAIGRRFTFPYHLVATWAGMEELIRWAFMHAEHLSQHVRDGRYDLVGPDGEIVLPQTWESQVQEGWSVAMIMWPVAEPPRMRVAPPRLPSRNKNRKNKTSKR